MFTLQSKVSVSFLTLGKLFWLQTSNSKQNNVLFYIPWTWLGIPFDLKALLWVDLIHRCKVPYFPRSHMTILTTWDKTVSKLWFSCIIEPMTVSFGNPEFPPALTQTKFLAEQRPPRRLSPILWPRFCGIPCFSLTTLQSLPYRQVATYVNSFSDKWELPFLLTPFESPLLQEFAFNTLVSGPWSITYLFNLRTRIKLLLSCINYP